MKFERSPDFGHDSWLNQNTDPKQIHAEHTAMVTAGQLWTGEDAIGGEFNLFDRDRDLYGSYVDNYGGATELAGWIKQYMPHAFYLTYTIYGHAALCADVEQYAMSNSDMPGWLDNVAWKDALGNSWGYTSSGNMGALISAAHGRHFIRVGAHYGYGRHVCGPNTCGYPQCDWTQWNDVGPAGQNVDQLIGTYLPRPKPVQPWQPPDEAWLCLAWDKQNPSPQRRERLRKQMRARADLLWKLSGGFKTNASKSYRNRWRRFQALWQRCTK